MTITAKYPGTCALCGTRFAAGERIEWTKGAGSAHVQCPALSAIYDLTDDDRMPLERARTNEQVEADREAAKHDRVHCLEENDTCAGAVQWRTPVSPSGVSYPRCDTHWARRLATEDEINRKHAD